jgi:lysyl-tRNA synthetase class II
MDGNRQAHEREAGDRTRHALDETFIVALR